MTHTPTRRLLALLLAVATVFSLLSMSVSAADEQTGPELKLVSTATEPLKKGDSFTVEVQFPKDAEFSNFELYFDFDLTQFKLVSVNTKYKVTIGNKEYEIPYVEDMLMVVNTDSVEYNGKTYGGSIATASAGTEERPNVTASEGVLFTLTFEVLKCNAEQQNISIFSKLFQKSTTLSDFEDITPVITPAQITISHTLTTVPAKDATCTEDGNKAYWICSACEKWFSDENGTTEITNKDSVVKKQQAILRLQHGAMTATITGISARLAMQCWTRLRTAAEPLPAPRRPLVKPAVRNTVRPLSMTINGITMLRSTGKNAVLAVPSTRQIRKRITTLANGSPKRKLPARKPAHRSAPARTAAIPKLQRLR